MSKVKYRLNVAAILQNAEGLILLGERLHIADAWQFPQGGVDHGENLEQALKREIMEELGVGPDSYQIGVTHGPYRYIFPNSGVGRDSRGQEQHYFLLHASSECRPTTNVPHPEFRALKWIQPQEFEMRWLPEMKKDVYQQVFLDFFGLTLR